MDLEIVKIWKRTERNGISAIFKHNNKYYYADLSDLKKCHCGNECMIFKTNNKGDVENWSELYCNRACKAIDKDSLMACINEFCEEKQELV